MTDERRKYTRKKVDALLQLYDINNEIFMGKVVDISMDGIMLLSRDPIPANGVWQLSIELPIDDIECQTVEFGAESLWCDDSLKPAQYWAGFHIIDISQESLMHLNSFVSSQP